MFDINWTKKTKIVVNGKEYERLEDVPEEFRTLLKAARGTTTWRIESFLKARLPPGEPLIMNSNVPVALPDAFQFDDDGGERRISWRWISLRAVLTFFFVALWDGILAVVLYGAFLGKSPPLPVLAILLIGAASGAAMSYASAAYLLNRTSVRVDNTRVSVRHGPLPWFGAKSVSRTAIERVFSERHARLDDDGGFEPRETYSVMLQIKGGVMASLVAGLRLPEQALFIEQQIRKP